MLRFLPIALLLLTLAACAGGNRFVLLEEEDGSVGAITVQNDAGSQTIEQASTGTQVASATAAPTAPEAISQEEIENHRPEDFDREKTNLMENVKMTPRALIGYIRTSLEVLMSMKMEQMDKTYMGGKKPISPSSDRFYTRSSNSVNTGYEKQLVDYERELRAHIQLEQ